jgi:hypothetical protein
MSKDDDNPFGSQPPADPFGRPTGGDPYGAPAGGDPYGPPVGGNPSMPPPPPKAEDAWRAGPAPPPAGQWAAPPRKAEGAVASLVLGILGVLICQLCAPVAWGMGRKAEQLVDASGGTLAGRGEATAGKILGMIGTAFLVLIIVGIIVLVAIGSTVDTNSTTSTTFSF